MKNALLGLVALALCVVVGMQYLSLGFSIPEGNRIVVIGSSIIFAGLGLGALSLLYLISPANRSWRHFLKAFVAFGTLISLSQCSAWSKRFNGPEQTIESADGLIAVEVPSDWYRLETPPSGANIAVADWAGTGMVMVNSDVPGEGDYTQDQVEAGAGALDADTRAKGAQPIGPVPCGALCVAKVYSMAHGGKERRVVMAVKGQGPRLLSVVAVGAMSDNEKRSAELAAIVSSARVKAR